MDKLKEYIQNNKLKVIIGVTLVVSLTVLMVAFFIIKVPTAQPMPNSKDIKETQKTVGSSALHTTDKTKLQKADSLEVEDIVYSSDSSTTSHSTEPKSTVNTDTDGEDWSQYPNLAPKYDPNAEVTGTPEEQAHAQSLMEELLPETKDSLDISVSKDIPVDYKDPTGKILPQDPREDSRMEEGWSQNFSALKNMVFEPESLTMLPDMYFYVNRDSWDNGLKTLYQYYTERSVFVANSKYLPPHMKESGLQYTMITETIPPDKQPTEYPVSDIKYLIHSYCIPQL